MRARVALLLFGAGLLVMTPVRARAQEPVDSVTAAEALRVFLDCRSRFCDFDFFRREITFVNYVRDRMESQVHVLILTQRTGSGEEFSISFIGREEFAGIDDSLKYFSSQTDTEDEIRRGLAQSIGLGLVRYVARLPMADRLQITYDAPGAQEVTPQEVDDPWNYWIFRVRVGGNLGGEQQQRDFSGNLSLSANRTTEEWKIRLFASGRYSQDNFELSDGSELVSISRNYGTGGFIAKSISEHVSFGLTAESRVSTFRNHDLLVELGPLIEYNVFPYSESSERMFTFDYFLSLMYVDYELITLFGKLTEKRARHVGFINYSVEQPWGSIDVELEGSAFVDDPAMHRIELGGRINLRLVRGLQLNIFGSFGRIKDQIHLAREGATDEEVLLRLRELGTDFRYFGSVSLSYTFGSIFNNIVNPRFD
jgi:hypothetical protein